MSNSAPLVNSVTLVGRLTRDPIIRTLDDGRAVCDLRLAVGGSSGTAPVFVDVTSFGKPAEACSRYLSKGREVAVEGRLAFSEWTGRDGTKRSKHSVIGRVQFGAPRSEADAAPPSDGVES